MGLDGTWTIADEKARLDKAGGRVVYRFHARDVDLVLGPATDGKAARFIVRIDGAAPATTTYRHRRARHWNGHSPAALPAVPCEGCRPRTHLRDQFLDPVEAYAFTFG